MKIIKKNGKFKEDLEESVWNLGAKPKSKQLRKVPSVRDNRIKPTHSYS